MKTMKHEKLGSFFIALGLVLGLALAALATPSASAYGAVAYASLGINAGTRAVGQEADAMDIITREQAEEAALASCGLIFTNANMESANNCTILGTFNRDTEDSCFAIASPANESHNFDNIGFATGDEQTANGRAVEACNERNGVINCQVFDILNRDDFSRYGPYCDTTGFSCEDDELPNIADGSCGECTGTHVLVDEICEPIAECDADRQILNQTANECETCDFDKSPQNNECVCTDENTLDVEGTCTRILECIGNQIRDPEMPTECMNCGDKTANEERNLCEAACTGDNEVKDGEGDCRTCENDSIPNEENTECLPNCSNHDEYKDTDGYCVQCNTGLVASDNNDSCVAVPAVKTPSSKTGVVLGLVVLGVYAANVFAAPAAEVAAINWTPSYAFRNNNGNISYSVGSRWTARTDNWRYYWQTTQSGGKFSYGSGMNYKTGIFAATMDSESDSDITDLDISLSATKAAGLWHFNGGYNLDARLSATERTEMQNRLNIAARYSLDKWILSATANTDGERAAARINYSYRF